MKSLLAGLKIKQLIRKKKSMPKTPSNLENISSQVTRKVISKIYFKKPFLKNSITAIVRVKDEPLFTLSLLSVKHIIDQYIIITNGRTDLEPELKQLNINYVYLHRPDINNLKDMYIEALKLVKTRWVLKWDSDIIAYPQIKELKTFTLKLNPRYFYLIEFCLVGLCFHINKYSIWSEAWLYNYSKDLEVITPIGRLGEQMIFPAYYRREKLNNIYGLHFRDLPFM